MFRLKFGLWRLVLLGIPKIIIQAPSDNFYPKSNWPPRSHLSFPGSSTYTGGEIRLEITKEISEVVTDELRYASAIYQHRLSEYLKMTGNSPGGRLHSKKLLCHRYPMLPWRVFSCDWLNLHLVWLVSWGGSYKSMNEWLVKSDRPKWPKTPKWANSGKICQK